MDHSSSLPHGEEFPTISRDEISLREMEAIRISVKAGHGTVYYTSLTSLPVHTTPFSESDRDQYLRSNGVGSTHSMLLDESFPVERWVAHPEYLHCQLVNQPLFRHTVATEVAVPSTSLSS